MADGFKVEMRGLQIIDDNLVRLGPIAGAKVMRSVLYKAAKPIEDETKANIAAIRTGSGALHKATRRAYMKSLNPSGTGSKFTVSVAPKTKDQTAIALANFYYRRKKAIRGVFWGHLVEWGFRTRNGGHVSARHVFLRALQARSAQATAIFKEQIFKSVERALKKQNPV